MHIDIGELTADMILEKFGVPDVVWIAPDCRTFSLAAISKHRVKNADTGNLDPISDYAKKCDKVDQHVLSVLEELRKINPRLLFFIENPRACLLEVLSMYDGIATGRYCLEKLGYTNITYKAYEIDSYAKQVAMKNYPDIIQCGDAFQLREDNWVY